MKEQLRSLVQVLIFSCLLFYCDSIFAQDLEIRHLDSENYPELSLVVSGLAEERMEMNEKNLKIFENEEEAKIHYIRHGYPLAFGLRIFSSPEFVSSSLGDSTVGELLVTYLNSTFSDIDYFFKKDIPQHSLYDALQLNLEKMGKRKWRKKWFTVLLLDKGDTGSDTPFETILGTIDFTNSPIFVLFQGDEVHEELNILTQKSQGAFFLFKDSEDLLKQLQNLNRLWRWGTEIRYQSPQKSKSAYREIKVAYSKQGEKEQILTESYEQKSDFGKGINWDNWPAMLAAVLLSIGAVILFFYWRSRRTDVNHVLPAITYVAPEVRKGKLKLRFNSPNKEMGARITISTLSGSPVKDFIYSGRKRSAKVVVSDLPEGIYTCMLSNAGLNSEKVEFRIHSS